MSRNGIGENGSFSACHPIVNLIFFIFAIGITMFSMSPIFLGATFILSWIYSVLLNGTRAIKTNLMFMIPILVIMAVVNTLFTHNGATVLFYINNSRITLEAFIYGIAAAMMLTSVILWFSCFNTVMSSDKLIYLFGKAAPVLGLTLSMIFRFIPLLKERYREISMGQRCMGRHTKGGFFGKARQTIKEVSILISWSLEASIETSDSMEARGYGLPKRSSFHLFKFSPTDKVLIPILCVLGVLASAGCFMGKTSIYFYPKIVLGDMDLIKAATLVCFVLLLITPIFVDLIGEKRWQQSR